MGSKGKGHKDGWKMFTGDDVCYPVEVFLHTMELKAEREGPTTLSEETGSVESEVEQLKIANVLNHIPSPKFPRKSKEGEDPPPNMNVPSALWKHRVQKALKEDEQQQLKWPELKQSLLGEFQSKSDLTLKEKVNLIQSCSKEPHEDSEAYLVRIRCVVSLLTNNTISTESMEDLPDPEGIWVKLLFLIGLDDMEQNLIIEESDTKSLPDLCKVLEMPEVKSVRTYQMKHEYVPPPAKKMKKARRSVVPDYTMFDADFDDPDDAMMYDDGPVKFENEPIVNIKEEPVDSVEDPSQTPAMSQGNGFRGDDSKNKSKKGASDVTMEKMWSCCFCPVESYLTRKELWAHQDAQHDGYHHYCSLCNIRFHTKNQLTNHNNRRHVAKTEPLNQSNEPKMYQCCFCDHAPFKKRGDLWTHQDDLHEGYHERCTICDIKLNSVAELREHNKKNHQKVKKEKGEGGPGGNKHKQYLYDKISQEVEEANKCLAEGPKFEVQEPYALDEATQSWTCLHCPEQWIAPPGAAEKQVEGTPGKPPGKSEYFQHVREKHSGMIYKCHICSLGLKEKRKLAQHLWLYHDVQTDGFTCYHCHYDECNFKAMAKKLMGRHISRVHLRVVPKELKCKHCGELFTNWKSFHDHSVTIHNEVPENSEEYDQYLIDSDFDNHQCEQCGLKFQQKSHLRYHFLTKHSDEADQHLCTDCGQRFSMLRMLQEHQKLVHDPATETCTLCPPTKDGGVRLYTALSLKLHVQGVHNKKFSCPKCDWRNSTLDKLEDHYRIKHLKYLQFRCTQCDKRFSRGSNAKYHIQQVHEKNMERKIDQEFFDRNKGLFEDYALTDPNYPTSEVVRAKIEEARKKFKYQQPGSPTLQHQQQAVAVQQPQQAVQQQQPQQPQQPQALHHMPAPVLMTN